MEACRIAGRPTLKVCMIGSKKPYPAFYSMSSILGDILGQNQVSEVRITDWVSSCPPLLKFFLYVFQDLVLCLKVTSRYKKDNINATLIFQGYYALSFIAMKLLNIKMLLLIGGSGLYWSYLEHTSTMGKIFAYANLPIQKICHKLADVLITLSKNMVKMIGLENYELKTWFALPRFDKEFYSKFGIIKNYEHRSNVVGFVGSLCRRKGVLNLTRAIPLVTHMKEDCKFLLIGGGPLLEIIKTKVRELEKNGSVRITGFIAYDHLRKCYNEMKLYVLPTYAEGIPSTIFEAMACGAPVLVTPVGGIQDVIEDGETGFFLKSNDPEHIAEKIVKLLDDPELLERVSANAFRHVRENFSEEKVVESWRRILQELGIVINGKEKRRRHEPYIENVS